MAKLSVVPLTKIHHLAHSSRPEMRFARKAYLLLSQSKSGNETYRWINHDLFGETEGRAMRRFVIALVALGALTLRADAQTIKPAVGNEQVYWLLTVSVDKMDDFKSLVAKLVAATEKEPGALQYEYNLADDQKTIDIYERYTDSKAALFHLGQTFPNFSKEFSRWQSRRLS